MSLQNEGSLNAKIKVKQQTETWTLEDTIDSFLQPDDGEDEAVVQIGIRHDVHWLHCRHPPLPPQTVLGIWEDCIQDPDEQQQVNPAVELTVFESTDDSTATRQCQSSAPHREWTRESLLPQKDHSQEEPVRLHWYDIRQWQTQQNESFLETVASVCRFLRCLLGTSHDASPWVNQSLNEAEPHLAALVMLPNPPLRLTDFRVGNASPSFYLHSVSRLNLPKNSAWITSMPQSDFVFGDLQEASLLVFRRLSPRDHLTIRPDCQTPKGCLWESYKYSENENDKPVIKYRLVAPPYISDHEYGSMLEPLLQQENFDKIREEARAIPQWTAWPEKQHYSSTNGSASTWTVFPLCHCFPANKVENRKWIETTCAFVPQTIALLKENLGNTLRTALFSRLDAQTTLEPHTGWEDLANHVYRIHLPLVVPPGGLCGTWVDGVVETHEERRLVCFDDSKTHRAFNYSGGERIVLILDLERPHDLPAGTATGGHTDELDKFISQLT